MKEEEVGDSDNGNNGNGGVAVYYPPAADSTIAESIIAGQIEGIQRMIKPYDDDNESTTKAVIELNPSMKGHWESEIKILRESPRDEKKLRTILKAKQKEYEIAEHNEDIERLVTEIEMLKFVLFLVCRDLKNRSHTSHSSNFPS